MIKALIIEDEIQTRAALKKMLSITTPSLKVVGETGYIKDALALIQEQKPNIVFIDIKLEDGTGFDILSKLNKIDFKIIFTTAYNQYAIKAFKFSAIDYLLKPIDPLELKEAIARASTEIYNNQEYHELLRIIDKKNTEPKKIVLKTIEQRYVINISDIIRLEADGAYTLFITNNNKIIVSKNIKYYQEILGEKFIRCHQSHLINPSHIIASIKNDYIKMSNHDLIPIASRKKSTIMDIISKL